MKDYFRPHSEPARSLYDALLDEADHRHEREADEWIRLERQRMIDEATMYAKLYGLRQPSMADIMRAETQAMGHVDYAAKFAYGVVDAMKSPARTGGPRP